MIKGAANDLAEERRRSAAERGVDVEAEMLKQHHEQL